MLAKGWCERSGENKGAENVKGRMIPKVLQEKADWGYFQKSVLNDCERLCSKRTAGTRLQKTLLSGTKYFKRAWCGMKQQAESKKRRIQVTWSQAML